MKLIFCPEIRNSYVSQRRNLQMAYNDDMYYVLNIKWDLLVFFYFLRDSNPGPSAWKTATGTI